MTLLTRSPPIKAQSATKIIKLTTLFVLLLPYFAVNQICALQSFEEIFLPCTPPIVELDVGYRNDDFHWGTTFSNTLEEISSDIDWNDLSISELRGLVKYESACHLYLRGFAEYGIIFSGTNRNNTSISIDNQTTLLAQYRGSGRGGSVFDFSAGIGYAFHLGEKNPITIAPPLRICL